MTLHNYLTRRWFLKDCGVGLGTIALHALLQDRATLAQGPSAAPAGWGWDPPKETDGPAERRGACNLGPRRPDTLTDPALVLKVPKSVHSSKTGFARALSTG